MAGYLVVFLMVEQLSINQEYQNILLAISSQSINPADIFATPSARQKLPLGLARHPGHADCRPPYRTSQYLGT